MAPDVPLSTALAGGAMVGALLDALLAKQLLTPSEVRSILSHAQDVLADANTEDAIEAARIISEWMQKLPE